MYAHEFLVILKNMILSYPDMVIKTDDGCKVTGLRIDEKNDGGYEAIIKTELKEEEQ